MSMSVGWGFSQSVPVAGRGSAEELSLTNFQLQVRNWIGFCRCFFRFLGVVVVMPLGFN
jgi:hypothetical protein